ELRYFRGWPAKLQKVNDEIPTHRATSSSPMTPRPERHAMMNAVGGTSIHYWGQSWRLNPWDFKVVSETRRRYGASRIPKGSTVGGGLAVRLVQIGADLGTIRAGDRGFRPGRQYQWNAGPPREHLRRPEKT